ncbi:MAG: hypothetical protein HYR85_25935 [Planctomycetes bacterium]|nr:hypothetical protein [Planctomycetota bacterium]MBI3848040.1 hypothetical protein [Planctomycetota bacterium]
MSTTNPAPRGGIKWFIALAIGSFLAGRGILGLLHVTDTEDPWTQFLMGLVAIAISIAFRVLSRREMQRDDA